MADFMTLNPADFTVEQLISAARGEVRTLKPQLAVALLAQKLGREAGGPLAELALSDATDQRARHAATLALAAFPAQRGVLQSLRTSAQPLVAQAAAEALRER